MEVNLLFFRSLMSQSAASITMSSICGHLRSVGCSCSMVLLEKNDPHHLTKIFQDSYDTKIIIAKPNFKDFREFMAILRMASETDLVKRIFLCGPFASLNAHDILTEFPFVDGVVTSNQERVFESLVSEDAIPNIPGFISLKSQGMVLQVPKLSLEEISFPARDIEAEERLGFVNLEFSRGCSYGCSFCHIPLANGNVVDFRSPVKVVNEIESLVQMGKSLFIFNDSCFWASPKDNERVSRLCDEILARHLDIHMYVYLRCSPLIPEWLLDKLVDCGLVRVFLGVENFSTNSLKILNKGIDGESIYGIHDYFSQKGVDVHIGFIHFEPYSTFDDLDTNFNGLYDLGHIFRLGIILEPTRIIPGSPLHNRLIKDGLLFSDEPKMDLLTYGYHFVDPRVELFLSHLREKFLGVCPKETYLLEYYCTVGKLLSCLIKRHFAGRLPDEVSQILNEYQKRLDIVNGFLRDFFLKTSQVYKGGGQCLDLYDFQSRIGELSESMQFIFFQMVLYLRSAKLNRLVREIYHGKPSLN